MEICTSAILTRAHLPSFYSYPHHSPKRRKRLLSSTRSNPIGIRFNSNPRRESYRYSIRTNLETHESSSSTRVLNEFVSSADANGSPEFVEVIGIGSRKDAVFNFCSDSPFLSPNLRFWSLIIEDSTKMQLHQFNGKDVLPTVLEFSSGWEFGFKAVILVATAAYASDDIRVLDILQRVKSANGLVVGIIIKPFSFEGRRRQLEVKQLADKLQEHVDFCIGIDTDVLLEKDFVTLDEALKTANTAILMAMNAVSVLVSESNKKLLATTKDNMEELEVSQIVKILEGYKQAEVGFATGYNINTSTSQAIYDCPFLSGGLKDLDGIVIAILASSDAIERSDIQVLLRTLHNTEFEGQIILSIVQEPNLEPNHIRTTVLTVSHTRKQASQESSILSRLSQRFPFIFNLFGRQNSESKISKDPTVTVMDLPDSLEIPEITSADSKTEGFGNYSTEIETLLSNKDDELYNLSVTESKEIGSLEPAPDYSSFYDPNTKGVTSYEREPLIRKFEPISNGQEDFDNDSADTSLLDKLSIFKLPVGVKPSSELKNSPYSSDNWDKQEADENLKAQKIQIALRMSANASGDMGFEAVSDLLDTGSPALKGTFDNVSKREGVLSSRAASMLESERHSQKKWSPIMEMKYRGGLYKGRCQGGLPEGKGRLSLPDGSIYDGMWRYGKRSGLGTFYFSNGDFYQGSWRDDVMHGKGWLYFHTGDRWFVNFWKGKANGESRFYSKIGEIFFGHFNDGWRHGHFLCINVDGERYLEEWDEGVLLSKKQLDADPGT